MPKATPKPPKPPNLPKMPVQPKAKYKAVARRPHVANAVATTPSDELRSLGAGWRVERAAPSKAGKTVAYRRPAYIAPDGTRHHSIQSAGFFTHT